MFQPSDRHRVYEMNDYDRGCFINRQSEQQRRQRMQSYIQCSEARQTEKWLALLESGGTAKRKQVSSPASNGQWFGSFAPFSPRAPTAPCGARATAAQQQWIGTTLGASARLLAWGGIPRPLREQLYMTLSGARYESSTGKASKSRHYRKLAARGGVRGGFVHARQCG